MGWTCRADEEQIWYGYFEKMPWKVGVQKVVLDAIRRNVCRPYWISSPNIWNYFSVWAKGCCNIWAFLNVVMTICCSFSIRIKLTSEYTIYEFIIYVRNLHVSATFFGHLQGDVLRGIWCKRTHKQCVNTTTSSFKYMV